MDVKRGWFTRTTASRARVPTFHEQFAPLDAVVGPSDRSFGLTVGCALLLIWAAGLLGGRASGPWLVAVGVGFIALSLATPRWLAPLNKLWLKFGLLLHRIVTPVVLAFLFYLVFAPTGLLLRALGGRPLRLRREPQLPSYWIARASTAPPDSMRRQF